MIEFLRENPSVCLVFIRHFSYWLYDYHINYLWPSVWFGSRDHGLRNNRGRKLGGSYDFPRSPIASLWLCTKRDFTNFYCRNFLRYCLRHSISRGATCAGFCSVATSHCTLSFRAWTNFCFPQWAYRQKYNFPFPLYSSFSGIKPTVSVIYVCPNLSFRWAGSSGFSYRLSKTPVNFTVIPAGTITAIQLSSTAPTTLTDVLSSAPPAMVSHVSLFVYSTVHTTSVVSSVLICPNVSSSVLRIVRLSAASAAASISVAPAYTHGSFSQLTVIHQRPLASKSADAKTPSRRRVSALLHKRLARSDV